MVGQGDFVLIKIILCSSLRVVFKEKKVEGNKAIIYIGTEIHICFC